MSARETVGMAAFSIVGAPHMTPYMVSIESSFLLIASVSQSPENVLSLGNMFTQSPC
jgi:hypothetical protein